MITKNKCCFLYAFVFLLLPSGSHSQETEDTDNVVQAKQEIDIDDSDFISSESITTYIISYETALEISAKLIDEVVNKAHLSKNYMLGLQESSRLRGFLPKLSAEYSRNRDNNLNDKNNGDDNLDSRTFSAGLTHDYSISLSFDFRDIPLNQYDVQLAWTGTKIGIARNKLIQEINQKFFTFIKLNRVLNSPATTLSPQKKSKLFFLMMRIRSELDAISEGRFSKMMESLPQRKIRG